MEEIKKKRGRLRKNPPVADNVIQLSDVKNPTEQDKKALAEFSEKKKVKRDRTTYFLVGKYDPADVTQSLEIANYWRRRGRESRIQTNEELESRIEEYLNWCQDTGAKPLVEGIALAIGYTRKELSDWKNGINTDSERKNIITAMYETLAYFDSNMAVNNKMNPVVYFFRSKNYYGMKDESEVVITPNNPLGDTISVEEIEKKYAYLPGD